MVTKIPSSEVKKIMRIFIQDIDRLKSENIELKKQLYEVKRKQ